MNRRLAGGWAFGVLVICVLLGSGCRSTYYAAYEKFGVYKRDLLKKRVVAAHDEQKRAGQQFQSALTRLKAMTDFDGGQLEKTYNALQSDYDGCASKSEAVRKRIRDMETVAGDLFVEWEKEIQEISTPSLQQSSRKQLHATRERYEDMHQASLDAEKALEPVLRQFKDYVLYLKHNLNAQALASLKGEAANIQGEIAKLIARMNESIAQADAFVKAMP
jgi:chromosome segregation ATPase